MSTAGRVWNAVDAALMPTAVRSQEALDRELETLMAAGFRLAVVLLRDRGEAEDVVQEAALLAWRKAGQVREVAMLRSWFLAIVANQCRSVRRRRWWSVLKLAEPRTWSGFGEESLAEGLDLAAALGRLSDEDRLALYLHCHQDLTLEEAARVVGCGPAAFRSRFYRARERLRAELAS